MSHNSSPTTHTHTADGEAERLTCPRVSPSRRGRARGNQGTLQQKLQGRKGSRKRRKESPWSGY